MRCADCRWWNEAGVGSYGNRRINSQQVWARPCQRYPVFEPRWFDDFCGEFQAKDTTNDQ